MPLATIRLQHPITVRGEPTQALCVMRRANLGDLRAASKGADELDTLQILLSRLCEITRTEADEIDADDVPVVIEALAPFMGGGQTTGVR